MPFELGILFGTLPIALLDRFVADNPNALKDIDQAFMNAFGINVIPTIVTPLIEQESNRSLFSNKNIVPDYLKDLLPEYQYTSYTTETAKAISRIIGAFPGIKEAAISNKQPFVGGVARALTTPILY